MRQIAFALIVALGVTGCAPWFVRDGGPGHGPPAHAPAHGRRAKHGGRDLVFDTDTGVYVVVGYPGFYFFEDRYYRIVDGFWQISVAVDGPWNVVGYEVVPSGLVKKHGKGKSKDKGKEKGKGKGKGKG